MEKTCTSCQETKPLSKFHRNGQRKDGRESRCGTCRSARMRELNARNPQARDAAHYKHRVQSTYGIDASAVAAMQAAQGGVCAICLQAQPGRRPSIDHCHSSGNVRGLLCNACNLMLGHAKDNPLTLQRAIAYLAGGV